VTSDQLRLEQYVAAWISTIANTVALLRDLDEDDWARPTDLPGWDVRAVAAHLAHLESELAGNPQAEVGVPELPHIRSLTGVYTEMGPLARADWTTEQIIDELDSSTRLRGKALEADPPVDGSASPPRTPGGIGWNWETLLSNRVVDAWMHEQDIRRAVGRPGSMDTAGAAHTVSVFARSFGYVVGKRVGAPPGTTVVLDVTGVHPVHLAVEVDPDGRGVPTIDEPREASVTLRMDLDSYILLAGGRVAPDQASVEVLGDADLGMRILSSMAVTP
jgi:uncharacterized protein (TIGR03083 family)